MITTSPLRRSFKVGRLEMPRVLLTIGLPLAVLIAACVGPLLIDSSLHLSVLTAVFLNASLAAGLVISVGYAGLINLSQATFYGIGAYATANLVTVHGLPLLAAMPLAMVFGAAGAMILGLASVRVRGDYFALVSLAFSIAMTQVMENWSTVTRGREGYFGIPVTSILGWRIDSAVSGYFACLFLLAGTYLIVARFVRTYAARAMLAVRYDESAAAVMGISVRRTKLLAMAMSGALGGLAGSFLVATYLFVKPSSFDFMTSFNMLLWVIIGGMASLAGAVLTSSTLTFITEQFRTIYEYRTGFIGLVVVVAVFYRGGVFHDWHASIRARRQGRKEAGRATS